MGGLVYAFVCAGGTSLPASAVVVQPGQCSLSLSPPRRLAFPPFRLVLVTPSPQYSVTSSFRLAIVNGIRQNVLPGAFWVYDISPFMVVVTRESTPFFEFLTGLCAIVGGVFTVSARAWVLGPPPGTPLLLVPPPPGSTCAH